ncbi:MAG: peptide-methionine (S)-S-oxide reductase MsrA [Rhizobiales bacterium]|nr:peptide-methionine (S)-S-oxide reductase MsrA [Hyphomicrobiales bacterium]
MMRLLFIMALTLLSTISAKAEVEEAIFAGGCFWCVESDFDHVEGVISTTSGYIGGETDNPTYKNHGNSGHLEAVKISFDNKLIDFQTLVNTFWRTIDVEDDKGQFCDKGNSYRTAVFATSDEQRKIALASKESAEKSLGKKILTRIIDATAFWPAEEYHQNYHMKSTARYNYYRRACGRDGRVQQLWGEQAYLGVK